MAEEEKPATLPGKECEAAKASDQPKGLSEGQVESSAEAQIAPEESAPAGTPQEKSIKEVAEVSPEVKTPSSAREGVSFLGFACVLLQKIDLSSSLPTWCLSNAIPSLGLLMIPKPLFETYRAESVACAGAVWQLDFPLLQLIPGFTLPWYNTLCSQADDTMWAFFRPRSSSQMFASHIANTCIFLFLFWGTAIHMLFFQTVETDFGTYRLKR